MNKDELATYILTACNTGLSEGRNLLVQFQYSKEALIGKPFVPSVITHLAKAYKLSVDEARSWYSAYLIEPEENGRGITNALTRAANGYNGDARVNLQTVASDFLTPSLTATKQTVIDKWTKITERAAEMSEKEVIRYTRITS